MSPWIQAEWRARDGPARCAPRPAVTSSSPTSTRSSASRPARTSCPNGPTSSTSGLEQRIGADAPSRGDALRPRRARHAAPVRHRNPRRRRPRRRGVSRRAVREPARRICARRRAVAPARDRRDAASRAGSRTRYGRNRYHDVVSGETFWGDFDQRHTLNAYALYRRPDRPSFVAKLRYRQQLSDSRLLCEGRRARHLPRHRCAQHGAAAGLRPARSARQPHVQLVAPPAHAVRGGHQPAQPRQRPLQSAARSTPSTRAVTQAVRLDAADRAVGRRPDRVLTCAVLARSCDGRWRC